ncbi:DUF3422 domain-containing protein [Sphingomonas sp. MG17]|uniref:DUF3422 domain-containing protein n=1 Tax=Sphingomonas tagetis TaxID=2949092 RepID=A0A9X2HLJ3_9SPHN|nr:DUF3422 domain-containing protein [Sphingomonas tagetis]MCP3729979.1 DUF3422 domain-containing protein [Sphingomonas tagetis]
MHLRKPLRLAAPGQMIQFVMLADHRAAAAAESFLHTHISAAAIPGRFWTGEIDGFAFAFERHSEFITYSFIAPGRRDDLFDVAQFAPIKPHIDAIPGKLIRANHVQLLDAGTAIPSAAQLARHFSLDDLVSSTASDGKAQIWSDFRIHGDGFGRLLIADKGLAGSDASLLTQRLQELGNYRKMALLGLPIAQEHMPRVGLLEQQLADLAQRIADERTDDDAVMADISRLSAEVARIGAQTRFRMSATQAYAEICLDRLESLEVRPVAGFPSLGDFTERRLLPAMRTCAAFSRRLDDLAERAAWTDALLRTRIDTQLARQNRNLLASMNHRTDMQLRLQQTVEGLSAVAISYYLIGLLAYVVKAAHLAVPAVPVEAAIAVLVPIVLAVVALTVRRLRHVGG